MKLRINIFFILIFFVSIVSNSTEIEEITIFEKKIQSLSLFSNNQTILSISEDDLNNLNAQHPKQIFRRLSGTWISRGSGQEHLTAIRSPILTGPGACGSFLILEDGLPIRSSGFCNVNGLIETPYEVAKQIEVIKGPVSSRYGANAMHGVINIISKPVNSENKIYTSIGPNNYKNLKLKVGNKKNISINGYFSNNDGFRNASGYDQQKLKFQSSFFIASWKAKLNATLTNLNQETAGYINGFNSYKNDSLSKLNFNPDAYRDANSQKISISISQIEDNILTSVTPYFRLNDMKFLQHYLPGTPLEKNSHISTGLIFQQIIDYDTFNLIKGIQVDLAKSEIMQIQKNNLTTSSAFNNATRPKGKHYDYKVNSSVFALFLGIEEYFLSDRLNAFADARAEFIEYDYSNNMLNGNTKEDGSQCGFGGCYYNRPSDSKDSFNQISGRLGLITKNEKVNYFTQLSVGFRPPQISEKYRLQKQQNISDINSETLTMLEIGAKYNLNLIDGKISFYKGKKSNSIFRDSQNFIIDNGKTKHEGIDVSLDIFMSPYNYINTNISFGDHKYNFETDTSMQERIKIGNIIDTAPKIMANLIWSLKLEDRLTVSFEIEHMSSYFTDAANEHEYDGHTLYHFQLNRQITKSLKSYFKIENVTNKRYAERADFNAFGGDRYFPGLPREIYIGLELKY